MRGEVIAHFYHIYSTVLFMKIIEHITYLSIQNRIQDRIGKPVQLKTKNDLSHLFRGDVLLEAKLFYQNKYA